MPLLSTAGGASVRGFRPYSTLVTAGFISATGGTITTSGNYKIHTFTSSGTFTVTSAPSGKYIDFLVVGAGGSWGQGTDNTGGGGGGVVIKENQVPSAGSYSVTIGAGGSTNGANGASSVFFGITALGGGAGATSNTVGNSGGSGGGSATGQAASSALQPTSASGGFGNPGAARGGGGAGSAASADVGGDGYSGSPLSSSLYGAGGNGFINAVSVSANTGNGGGVLSSGLGTPGASGVVIVRYLYQ